MRTYWVYILSSRPRGTIYIGVTNSLLSRIALHRSGEASAFTSKYRVSSLVYFEAFGSIKQAIQREKSLKRYRRQWKINLVEGRNPYWMDLYPALCALPENMATCADRPAGLPTKPLDED